jgi:cellulose biosynthesis protein BcsQ
MSTSGNGPSVITIAPESFDEIDEQDELTDGGNRMANIKNVLKTLRGNKSDKPKKSGKSKKSSRKAKLNYDAPDFDWVRASKPVADPLQFMFWKAYVFLNLYRTLIEPPKEVSYFRVKKVAKSIMKTVNFVREESAAIIAVIAVKGGVGKTTISTWFAAAMAWATKLSAAIVDTDRGGGLVASRFKLNKTKKSNGEIKRPLNIYDVGTRIEAGEYFTPEVLINETVSDKYTGVMIFHAPPGQGMGVERTGNMLRHLRSQYAGGLVVDTTPGLRVPMTNAAALTANVKIIVAQGLSDESIEGVRTALNFKPYNLRDSIDTVLVVIVALPVKKCNRRTAYELVGKFNLIDSDDASAPRENEVEDQPIDDLVEVSASHRLKASQVLFLPSDPYMDNHRVKELGPVRFTAVKPRTQLALAQLVKAKDDIILCQKATPPIHPTASA